METEFDRSKIERLKRGLDNPANVRMPEYSEAKLSASNVDVPPDWRDNELVRDHNDPTQPKKRVGALKIVVLLATLSLFLSGGYLLYDYFDPFSSPSERNIEIAFDMPVGASPGIPVDIALRITNNNRVALEYANVTLMYPTGVRIGENPETDLKDEKKSFGVITAGETAEYRTKAIFLGEEESEKEVRAAIEFRFAGINSIFTKSASHPIRILAAPINLSISALKEVSGGQPMELSVSALSNTVIPLRDVLLRIDYPANFVYSDAEPKPDFGANIWRVGTLAPSGKFAVKIRGVLSGSETDEKVFHASVGVGGDKTARDIGTLYAKTQAAVEVSRPFIGIALSVNGKPVEDNTIVQFGSRVEALIDWRNNLPTRIENAQIEVKLSGAALNRSTVSAADGGFYRSSDNTIIWDKRGNPTLGLLESGAEGVVNFYFQPLPSVAGGQSLQNPTIKAEVTVRGSRIAETGVPEEIKSVLVQNIRVASQAQFASRAVYYVGPFVNTGPIPPKVEQETTYTVIWSIVNTSNNLTNAQVRAVLPVYMKWYGSVSPSQENIMYNKNTNEIVWSPGNIPAGTGVEKPPREVAFQLVLTPSLSQMKTAPSLITQTVFTGTDAFTGTSLRQEKLDITTNLVTDPKADIGSDLVTQ